MKCSQSSVRNVTSTRNNDLIKTLFRKHKTKEKDSAEEKVGYPFFFASPHS